VLQPDLMGGLKAETIYKKRRKTKKQTRGLKELGKGVRRIQMASQSAADDYIQRHDRSNRKRRDGWARDLGINTARATRKGAKKIKVARWI
jgi:hypothetical protein